MKKIIISLSLILMSANVVAKADFSEVLGRQPEVIVFDREDDLNYLKKEAARGNAIVQYYLNEHTMDPLKAFNNAVDAALDGDANALLTIADAYQNSKGIPINDAKAFKLYSVAAENGVIEAYNRLGDFYDHGIYVDRDAKKAFDYYLKSNDYRKLATMYLYGSGVPENKQKAIEYYLLARDYLAVGDLFFEDEQYAKALEYYQKESLQDSPEANYKIALMYDEGLGVKRDAAKAMEYYKSAYFLEMEKYEIY